MVTIKSYHVRLAELWQKKKNIDELSETDWLEIRHCLELNRKFVESMATLENWSQFYHMIGDTESQHKVCGWIDELANDPHSFKVEVKG